MTETGDPIRSEFDHLSSGQEVAVVSKEMHDLFHSHSCSPPPLNSSINFKDFQKRLQVCKLKVVFDELDADGSGAIDQDEITEAMQKLGYKVSSKQCEAMLRKLDSNNDGVVSFEEFIHFFEAFPHASYGKLVEHWVNSVQPTDCGGDISATLPTAGLHWWQTVIAGGSAGVLSRTLTAPLEKIKINAQVAASGARGGGMLQEVRNIIRQQGVRGLFAGNLANCVRVFPTAGITCTCYLNLLSLTPADAEFDAYEPVYRMACGGTAALVANSLTYPLDIIRAHLTVSEKKLSVGESIRAILDKGSSGGGGTVTGWHKVKAFYRGIVPTLLAVIPFIALQNTSIDLLRDKAISEGFDASPLTLITVGAVSGIVAQTVVYPLDVLRRRIQLAGVQQGGGSGAANTNILSDNTWMAMKQIVRQNGFRSLFAGIVPTFAKTIPSVAVVAAVTGTINSYFRQSNKLSEGGGAS